MQFDIMVDDHEKDLVRLETVRALVHEANLKVGASAVTEDPIGKVLINALETLEGRNIEYNRAILGLK